eukprot:scaffold77_cov116-Isochrysis_galbana.AAC.10
MDGRLCRYEPGVDPVELSHQSVGLGRGFGGCRFCLLTFGGLTLERRLDRSGGASGSLNESIRSRASGSVHADLSADPRRADIRHRLTGRILYPGDAGVARVRHLGAVPQMVAHQLLGCTRHRVSSELGDAVQSLLRQGNFIAATSDIFVPAATAAAAAVAAAAELMDSVRRRAMAVASPASSSASVSLCVRCSALARTIGGVIGGCPISPQCGSQGTHTAARVHVLCGNVLANGSECWTRRQRASLLADHSTLRGWRRHQWLRRLHPCEADAERALVCAHA